MVKRSAFVSPHDRIALDGCVVRLSEPSIGLHPRDPARLIKTLQSMRNIGHTVLVVRTPDGAAMEASDWIVDLRPGAGQPRRQNHL